MKKIKNIILLVIVLIPLKTFAILHLEGGGGLTSGGTRYRESFSGYYVDHSETILCIGMEIMGRLGVDLGNISITASVFHDWEASSLTYQASNQSIFSSGAYSVVNRRLAYGPSIAVGIPAIGISLIGEYYLNASNTIQWTETKSQNPFRAGDYFTGWGYGIGISKVIGNLHLNAMVRGFTFNKATLNGVTTDLPGTRFDNGGWFGGTVGGSYSL